MKQQAIDILDEMIKERRKDIDIDWWEDNEYCARVSASMIWLQEAKSRIQALWYEWTYQDQRPNDRWIEY